MFRGDMALTWAAVTKVLGAQRARVILTFLREYALLGAIAAILATFIALIGAPAALDTPARDRLCRPTDSACHLLGQHIGLQ